MKPSMTRIFVGVLSVIAGLLAVFNPLSASVAATTLTGWALVIVGALQGYSAWQSTGMRVRLGTGIGAAAALSMGLLLLFGSFAEGSFLRTLLGVLLLISGVAKLWFSRQLRQDPLFLVIIAAGVVSLLLGAAVLTGVPGFLARSLGVVLGLELMANGVALIVLSMRPTPPARLR